jgi:micrococcal nuclease
MRAQKLEFKTRTQASNNTYLSLTDKPWQVESSLRQQILTTAVSHYNTATYIWKLLVLLASLLPAGLAEKTTHKVARVTDGDAIELENGERVRYTGIDTPETKHPSKPVEYYGREADSVNRSLVEGKGVRLEFDVQRRDKYNRLLAYVYVDDIFVNAWLVENGYAKTLTIPPNVRYAERFLELQQKAREEGKGLWGEKGRSVGRESGSDTTTVFVTKTGKKYYRKDCRYLRYSRRPISLREAVSEGYEPCKVCQPPLLPKRSSEVQSSKKSLEK